MCSRAVRCRFVQCNNQFLSPFGRAERKYEIIMKKISLRLLCLCLALMQCFCSFACNEQPADPTTVATTPATTESTVAPTTEATVPATTEPKATEPKATETANATPVATTAPAGQGNEFLD